MQQTLQQAFEKLKGLPLTKTTRNELVQYFHFGSTHYTTPQGLVLDIGELMLAVNCPWQLQQQDTVIKHNEVFMRKREAGLPSPKFDWKVPGANLRDQRLMEFVNAAGTNLVVEHVEQLENFGLTVHFSGPATLTLSPNPENPEEEYWQLFSNTGDGLRVGAGKEGFIG